MAHRYNDKMNIEISGICRHPIKSIGAEEITSTIVKRNNTLEYVNSFAKCIYICCMDYYSVNDLICSNRDIELEKYNDRNLFLLLVARQA